MSALVFAIAFVAVALLVYMGRFSGRVRAEREQFIAAPLPQVQARLADLSSWGDWNPWLAGEAGVSCRVTGARSPKPNRLEQRFELVQPFKVRLRSRIELLPQQDGTLVRWQLKGRVAFWMRAFAQTVQGMLVLDQRLGLDALRCLLDPHAPGQYRMALLGERELAARAWQSEPHRLAMKDLPEALPAAAERLRAGPDGELLVQYLKTHIKLRQTECRIGRANAAGTEQLPACRALVLRFEGPLDALELAWYRLSQHLRSADLQPDLQIPPHERYLQGPMAGEHNVVELAMALR